MTGDALSGGRPHGPHAIEPVDARRATQGGHLLALTWAFTLFDSARVVA